MKKFTIFNLYCLLIFSLIFGCPAAVLADDAASPNLDTLTAVGEVMPEAEPVYEPYISVGLWKTKDPVKFKSEFDYTVLAGDEEKGVLLADQTAVLSYKAGVYTLKSADLNFTSKNFIKLLPADPNHYFVLTNYERKLSKKAKENYNAYRGELIYKYSPKSAMPYVINRLLLDTYVAGIGEVSDGSAVEYIRAVLVAARSYAYFNINYGDPKTKFFDVYANTYDQLYLGYNCELLRPNVVQAAGDTYGQMVTYNDQPVTTPYFSNSGGSTKGWKEVWGGQDKPWLKSVVCDHDLESKKSGHGVGMSTHDASHRAMDDGWSYDQILTYYYSDTVVERIY